MKAFNTKLIRVLLVLSIVLSVAGMATAQTEISSCQDFQDIENNPGDDYELTQDIDCGGQTITPIDFDGSLDGQGFEISNIDIDSSGEGQRDSGLFMNTVDSGTVTVEDLTLSSINHESLTDVDHNIAILFSEPDVEDAPVFNMTDVTIEDSYLESDYGSGEHGVVIPNGEVNIDNVVVDNVTSIHPDGAGQGSVGVVRNESTISNFIVRDSEFTGGLAISSLFRTVEGGNHDNLYSINNEMTGEIASAGFITLRDSATLNGLLFEDNRIESTSDIRDASTVAFNSDAGYTISNVKIINNELTGEGALSMVTSSAEGTFEDLYVEGGTMTPSGSEDVAVFSTGGSATVNNFYVADTGTLNLAGSDDFFSNGDGSYTYDGLYYDSETTSISNTVATGLTTSEMSGDNAETNMPEFDFTNIWETQTEDYPELTAFILADPSVVLNSPDDGAEIPLFTDANFDFDVTTSDEDVDVTLELEKPDNSTETILSDTQGSGITARNYQTNYNVEQSGEYEWTVSAEGLQTSVSDSRSFSVPTPSETNLTANSPSSETIYGNDSPVNVEHDFSYESDIDFNATLEYRETGETEWNSTDIGEIEAGDSSTTFEQDYDVLNDSGRDIEWRVTSNDQLDRDSTSNTLEFEAFNVEEPTIDAFETVPSISTWYSDPISVDFEGSTGSLDIDRVDVNYCITSSSCNPEFGETVSIDASELDSTNGVFESVYEFLDYNSGYVGDEIAVEVEPVDTEGFSTTSERIIGVVPVADPEITDFTVESSDVENLEDAQPGDQFDVSVEGDKNADDIAEVFYAVGVSDQEDPESINREPEFQDQNSFSDSEDDAFTMEEEWQGETLTFQVQVGDTEDRVDSESLVVETGTPPEDFIYNSPDDDEVFLIPDGETDVEVDFDYGVEASNFDGTAELVLEGETEDSFSVDADSTGTNQFSRDLGDGQYEWFVRWNDSNGDSYSGGSREFQVSDEPIALSLRSPEQDEEILIDSGDETSVGHEFRVDARALDGDYYYEFVLNEDGEEILDRTSNDISGGTTESYTENADLDAGNYSWDVDIVNAENDEVLESSSSEYEVIANPEFESDLVRPVDQEVFYLEDGESQTDVNATYNVESFYQDVSTELSLDGSIIDERTIESDSDETVDVNMEDLEEDTYELVFNAEDENGRTQEETAEFEVKEPQEEDVEITEYRLEPSLEEARVGDELDVYIEGTGTPEDVDFIEFEVEVEGEVIDTILVPSEELEEGSWIWNGEDAITVTQDMIDKAVKVRSDVHTAAGNVISQAIEGITGSERQLFASPNNPTDGKTFEQTEGESEDIRFNYDVTTVDAPATAELLVRNETGDYGLVSQNEIEETDTTTEVEVYRNMEEELFVNQQFGNFTWKVEVEDDNGKSYVSDPRSFDIINETDEPILNFNQPRDNQAFYTEGDESVEVPFQFDVDTTEQGSFTLEVTDEDGSTTELDVPRNDIESGEAQRSVSDQFETGSYVADLSFDSDSYTASKTREFRVLEEEEESPEEPDVKLEEPQDGRTIYQNQGTVFGWSAVNSVGVSEDGTGNTTLYIENEDDEVVESFERDYDGGNEYSYYSHLFDADISQGQYTFYAELDAENLNETVTSDTREFSVTDFARPETELIRPDGDMFNTDDDIDFDWETESFEEEIDSLELRVREPGKRSSTLIDTVNDSQGSNSLVEYDLDENAGEIGVGDWEYFVRMNIDEVSFNSEVNNFTVGQSDIEDPEVELERPQQNERFELNGADNTSVDFSYVAEVFSQTSSDLRLMLQTVNESGTSDWETLNTEQASSSDGESVYEFSKNLSDSGYRWRVEVENPNGETYESDSQSFAVGDSDVPSADEGTRAGEIRAYLQAGWDYFDEVADGNAGLITGLILMVLGVGLVAAKGASGKTIEIVAVSILAFNGLTDLWPRGIVFALIVIASAIIYLQARGN